MHQPDERVLQFDEGRVAAFAEASGDRNPLHVDPSFARRTPYGECIVPGSLVAIALLGCLPRDVLRSARSLRASFTSPVLLHSPDQASARAMTSGHGTWEVRLVGRGRLLTRVAVADDTEAFRVPAVAPPHVQAAAKMRARPAHVADGDVRVGTEVGSAYAPGPELAQLARSWGAGDLDPRLLSALAWASYVVGMELPGLHSLFAGVKLSVDPVSDAPARVVAHWARVRDLDTRTGQLFLEGGIHDGEGSVAVGEIEAFVREPIPGPTLASFDSEPSEEHEGDVVVIGGSRGFGAALVLALATRGYTVHVLYSTSVEAAEELKQAAGSKADRLVFHRVDVREPEQLAPVVDAISTAGQLRGLALNAALPPLPMGVTAASADQLAAYVGENIRLAATPLGALLPQLDPRGGWVLFCSSAALTAPPRDWPHYVAAKGALEALAEWLAASQPTIRSVVLRAPKLLTDLTNTPSGRIGAVAPSELAHWVASRLAKTGPSGLTLLEPTKEMISAREAASR
jgi:NAD(P)-dependent dehydrogenase (short-subunit alcohol dehydrogenase family)